MEVTHVHSSPGNHELVLSPYEHDRAKLGLTFVKESRGNAAAEVLTGVMAKWALYQGFSDDFVLESSRTFLFQT